MTAMITYIDENQMVQVEEGRSECDFEWKALQEVSLFFTYSGERGIFCRNPGPSRYSFNLPSCCSIFSRPMTIDTLYAKAVAE